MFIGVGQHAFHVGIAEEGDEFTPRAMTYRTALGFAEARFLEDRFLKSPAGSFRQRTEITASQRALLGKLKLAEPLLRSHVSCTIWLTSCGTPASRRQESSRRLPFSPVPPL